MDESTIGFACKLSDTSTPLHGVGSRKKDSSAIKNNVKMDDIMQHSFEISSNSFDLSTSSLYEWRTFKDNYAQLILTDLISDDNNCSHDESESNDKNLPSNDVDMLRDLFREKASCLFHDIVDALNCSDLAQTDIDELTRRYDEFSKRTGILSSNVPNLSEEIRSRLISIRLQLNILMESTQQTKRSGTSCSTTDTGYTPLQQLRKWLQFVSEKMNSVKEQNVDWFNIGDLEKILEDQQALQVEIQRDGGALLAAAKKHLSSLYCSTSNRVDSASTSTPVSSDEKKFHLVFQSLERRWHGLWIKSLERQCILEALIKRIESGIFGEGDYESERIEPATKRRRVDVDFVYDCDDPCGLSYQHSSLSSRKLAAADTCSIASDTIPFSESEYESIMEGATTTDANGNFYSHLNTDDGDEFGKINLNYKSNTVLMIDNVDKIDNYDVLSAQDVGYASENSMHLSSNDESMLDCAFNNKNQIELTSSNVANSNDDHDYDRVARSPSAPSLCFVGKIKAAAADDNNKVDLKTSWSTSSSPSLERRNRIHNSPVKDYYKMMPDPTDVDGGGDQIKTSETESRVNGVVPEDARYVYTTKIRSKMQEMTDSLVVNVSESVENINALNEIVTLLDESFERAEPLLQFDAKMDQVFGSGTIWKQFVGSKIDLRSTKDDDVDDSCDASSELSADDKFHDDGDDLPTPRAVVVVDRGSLKRRWRRPTSTCLAEIFPTSVSETAIMNLSVVSSSSYGGSESTKKQHRHHQRKKLKARRIPRSISDSEHLSVLALCNRPLPYWSNPRLDFAPPCTPRGSTVSDSEETELDDEDGAGEGMAENEERMAGDGGSSISAEQSESVWEWDDYKPPNHCEFGPLDHRLDDSNLTAFGDDYRLCLDSAPTSARSDISEPVSASPCVQRLPPIGYACQESDSEPDGLSHYVDESRRHLRWARKNLDHQTQLNAVGSLCMREIRYLEKCIDQNDIGEKRMFRNRKRAVTGAIDLLKCWRKMFDETQMKQSARDEAVVKLIHDMGQSLKEFMAYLNYCPMSVPRLTSNSSYDDLLKEISMLKEASAKIEKDRKNLKGYSNVDSFNDSPELKMCTFDYDTAAEKCGSQLKLMENLYITLVEWKNLENACKNLLERLKEKLDRCFPVVENDAKSSPCHVLPDVATIQCDIESCEDRLNRLETVCNQLCSSMVGGGCQTNDGVSLYDSFSRDLRDQLNVHRVHLNALKVQFAELPSMSQENNSNGVDDDYVNDADAVVTLHRRQRKSSTIGRQKRTGSIGAKTKKRQVTSMSIDPDVKSNAKRLTMKNFRRMVRYTWPVHLCLLFAVCLGVYFFQADCCNDANYMNWAFGPRLDYVRGPPPS